MSEGVELGFPADRDGVKYVSGLSTILVATIQEAKDRISQIEYIFCNQLYPNFQSKSKSLQRIYLEAKVEAEDAWRVKENDLLCEIDKLQCEKRGVEEVLQGLEVEKEKALGELWEKVRSQESRINELQGDVVRRSKEVDESKEVQSKLLELVQTKTSLVADQGKQLKESEVKVNGLVSKVKGLEKMVEELQEEIRERDGKVAREKNVSTKMEFLTSELVGGGKLLAACGEEKKKLVSKLDSLEKKASELEQKLNKQMEEAEEGRALQAQLLQQIDIYAAEILKQKELLEDSENENKHLMDRLSDLEKKGNVLQEDLNSSSKGAERTDTYEKLLQQIELKDSELQTERKKTLAASESYRRLKSQYNYLCTKYSLTTELENTLPQNKLEDESGSLELQQNPTALQDFKNKNMDTSELVVDIKNVQMGNVFCDGLGPGGEMKRVKTDNAFADDLEDVKLAKSNPSSGFHPPTSSYILPKCPSAVKNATVIGTKRRASRWVDTRPHQRKDGPDPHDDFFNTPLENIRANLDKTVATEVHVHAPKEINPGQSDDETQDMNVDPCPGEQRRPVQMAGKRSFKYVEPVRKKAERDKLKGVECKQCRKFYDAVLPKSGGKDGEGNKQNVRCEHHEGVSRHRYKYMPPLTPEGFWNIGFESEM